VGEGKVRITTSIGVAGIESSSEQEVNTALSLIDRADRALYSAKNLGRNRIEVWNAALTTHIEH